MPNSGLGPYCVAKYGVVALAEVLWRELREHQIGVSVLCPMRVGTNIGQSERNRQADYGETAPGSRVADQDAGNDDLAGRVLDVDGVAALTVDAIEQNRLYVLPHEESRESIRRRFARIDRTFDEQPVDRAPAGAGGQPPRLRRRRRRSPPPAWRRLPGRLGPAQEVEQARGCTSRRARSSGRGRRR